MPPAGEDISASNAGDARTDAELDTLADSSEVARNSERPMTKGPEKETPEPTVKEETTYEFTHNGRPVKATKEQLIKWAQQGYDYPQKAQKLNQERQAWEKARAEWEQQWGTYRQIDDYAKQNKEWWDFIQKNWQSRGTFQPGQQPGAQPAAGQPGFDPQRFAQELRQQITQEFEQKYIQPVQQEKEDAALEQEIQSMRDQYKHLDWSTLDENGKHLETRILEHAQQNGIPTFKAALRDLLHDELLAKAEAQGKLAVSKGIQTKTKLGVLGESPTPQKGMVPNNRDIRKTSYEELMNDVRDELKRGVYG